MARPTKDPAGHVDRLTISLPPGYKPALEAYGKQTGRSPSNVVARLMERAGLVPDPAPTPGSTLAPVRGAPPVQTVTASANMGLSEAEKVEGSPAWKRRMIATGQAAKIAAWEKDQKDF